MNSLDQYIDLYRQHREAIDAHSASAINKLREKAWSELKHATLPTRKAEGYSTVSTEEMFAPDYGVNINRINIPVNVAATFHCDVPNLSTLLGVVVNDSFHATASLKSRLPEGVTFCSLREAALSNPEFVEKHLGHLAPMTDPAVALNTLLLQDGVLIHIARGVKLDKPLQLVNIFNASMPLMGVRRLLIVADEGAEASVLVCDHTQSPAVAMLSSEVVEIDLAADARLDYYVIESSSDLTSRHSSAFVRQCRDSRFNSGTFTLACGQSRNSLHVSLDEPGCETFLGGIAIGSASQRIDTATNILHNAPRGKSNQMFKYVLDGNALGGFEGRILVDPKAIATEAYQSNRNMLAAPTTRMHTEPQLEIYCDDVKCSHGATTGQLDEEALFYMRQRGIPLQQARTMLMQAFMSDVIDAVRMDSLRDRLRHLVERRFEGSTESCGSCAAQCH